MTTYAEKADIAAKAVKVLDSVRFKCQAVPAKKYSELAKRAIGADRQGDRSSLAFKIDMAFEAMVERMTKPRYTLKDGEWVRKWKPEQCSVGLLSHAGAENYRNAQRQYNAQMAYAAVNMGMGRSYSEQYANVLGVR